MWGDVGKPYLDEYYPVVLAKVLPKTSKCLPKSAQTFLSFSAVFEKNSEKSNPKKILPTSWRPQTPSKPPSTHPPDQAKCTKTCLGTNGRLGVENYDVLCIPGKKFRPRRGRTDGVPPGLNLTQLRVNRLHPPNDQVTVLNSTQCSL